MSAQDFADDLSATVHYALETTRAVAVCPFHSEVTIRVATPSSAPRGSLGAMARIGKRKTSGKKSHGSSAKQQMGSATLLFTLKAPRRAAHPIHPLAHSSRINLQHEHQA